MYNPDLAFVHDTGFADYALKSAPEIMRLLGRTVPKGELVVDLGCGSGLLTGELLKAGYRVLGIDISHSMIKLARQKAPGAKYLIASAFDCEIPKCAAVISVSECLNYMSEGRDHWRDLSRVFRRVHRSLSPGGGFIFDFDMAVPGQVPAGKTVTGFSEGDGWLVLVTKNEQSDPAVLTRRIITFRKVGGGYRRSEEIHHQALFKSTTITEELRRIGFKVRVSHSYGDFTLPPARAAFIARKSE